MFLPYLWPRRRLLVYLKATASCLRRLRVIWYSGIVYTRPRRRRELPSEGFSAAGEGDGVGHWFLGVAAVVVDLEQDGQVHEDLQQAARPELHGCLGEQEVDGFEGVAAGPHQDHLDARKTEKTAVKGCWSFIQMIRKNNKSPRDTDAFICYFTVNFLPHF